MITFDVIGVPCPQGSMRAFNANGHARVKPSGGNKFAAWRNAVSEAARVAIGDAAAMDGALAVTIDFMFPMPTSRPKWKRDFGVGLKTTAPDSDKLARCVCDALVAAAAIVDDARVVDLHVRKYETTSWTGATITVRRMDCP